jgi:chitin disaccharide deacetylase
VAAQRRIWLVADDYGISPAVSGAIRDLAARGRLSATSVMVTAPSFDRSQALALATLNTPATRVAIGLHVTLTAPFHPLMSGFAPTRAGAFPRLPMLMAHAFLGGLDRATIAAEIAAQFKAFAAAFDRPPDYVDGHQHVQLLPVVREALLAVTKETAPRAWVRQCGRVASTLSDPKGLFLDRLSRRFRAQAEALGIRTNPAFAGTYSFDSKAQFAALFPRFLDGLPDGSVVMCHPGEVDEELRRLDPLTDLRAREYAYLAGEDFAALLRSQGVSLRPISPGHAPG